MTNHSGKIGPRHQRPLAVLAALVLAVTLASCGDDDDGGERSATAPEVPSGWAEFDYGSVAGAAPESWTTVVMESSEFLELARTGLTEANVSSKAKARFEKLDADEVSEKVLVAIADTAAGFPNINVQLCFPGAKPISKSDGKEVASDYAKGLGVPVTVAGDVTVAGRVLPLFKVVFSPSLSTYQTVVGFGDCGSIATLTSSHDDRDSLADFETFLGLLVVEAR